MARAEREGEGCLNWYWVRWETGEVFHLVQGAKKVGGGEGRVELTHQPHRRPQSNES